MSFFAHIVQKNAPIRDLDAIFKPFNQLKSNKKIK